MHFHVSYVYVSGFFVCLFAFAFCFFVVFCLTYYKSSYSLDILSSFLNIDTPNSTGMRIKFTWRLKIICVPY